MTFTKEQLIAEVRYNLEHCFCSEKTKRLMEIALAALTAPQLPQPAAPDELAGKSFEYIANKFQVSMSEAQWILVGWNARSAAMLQGAEPLQGWIACSERMPEIEGHYLVWANASNLDGYCDHQAMATYQGGEWSNEFNWLVTHWMPLPEAPQQEVK